MAKVQKKRAAVKKGGRKALGRGLSSLISSAPVPVAEAASPAPSETPEAQKSSTGPKIVIKEREGGVGTPEVAYLATTDLIANPDQPRVEFSEAELAELTESIRTRGVLQPVLVRPAPGGKYEIVAGERRWRASVRAELPQLPVIIKELTDGETLEVALIENIQRADLTPLEEARAYQSLGERLRLSQREVAERVGKDRATVANSIRLLKLPADVQELLAAGKITTGHAKSILSVKEPSAQRNLANKVVQEGLSVRALEAIVSRVVVLSEERPKRKKKSAGSKSAFPEVVDRLRASLGTKVNIQHSKSGNGKIEIEYFSEDDLDRICEVILDS